MTTYICVSEDDYLDDPEGCWTAKNVCVIHDAYGAHGAAREFVEDVLHDYTTHRPEHLVYVKDPKTGEMWTVKVYVEYEPRFDAMLPKPYYEEKNNG